VIYNRVVRFVFTELRCSRDPTGLSSPQLFSVDSAPRRGIHNGARGVHDSGANSKKLSVLPQPYAS
jgi:hypothetical protein